MRRNQKTVTVRVPIFLVVLALFISSGFFLLQSPTPKQNTQVKGASSVVFNSIADAKVWDANPNSNYGTSPFIMNTLGGTGYQLSYIKFDNPEIPVGVTINTAKIKLTKMGWICTGTSNLKAYRVSNSWSESTVNYNNKPNIWTGGAESSQGCADSIWEFDVKEDLENMIFGAPNYGFAIIGNGVLDNYQYYFYSKEHTETSQRPVLEVTYTFPGSPTEEAPAEEPSTPTTDIEETLTEQPAELNESQNAESNVTTPTLKEVLVNASSVEAFIEKVVIQNDDTMTIVGKADAGNRVTVSYGKITETVDTNVAGEWQLNVEVVRLGNKTFKVYAKAISSDNKESAKIKLFEFEKKKKEISTDAAVTAEKRMGALYIIFCSLAIVMLGYLGYLVYTRKKSEKQEKKDKININYKEQKD